MLEYMHFVPGRLRVKVPELRNRRRAAETEADVATLPAVTKVAANPITGSLTINYDKQQLPISELWEILSARGYVSGRFPEGAGARDWLPEVESTLRFARTIMAALFDALVQHSAQALVRELL